MISISRSYTFDAAHRIEGHPKCGRLHGHTYQITVTISTTRAVSDRDGMLMDYGDLDKLVKPLIDAMDHRYLVSQANIQAQDPYAYVAENQGHAFLLNTAHSTAECLSQSLCHQIHAMLISQWSIANPLSSQFGTSVEVKETPKSSAVYSMLG